MFIRYLETNPIGKELFGLFFSMSNKSAKLGQLPIASVDPNKMHVDLVFLLQIFLNSRLNS